MSSFKNVFIFISHSVEFTNEYRISGFANKNINQFVFFLLERVSLFVDGRKNAVTSTVAFCSLSFAPSLLT